MNTKHTPLPWKMVKTVREKTMHIFSQPDKNEMYKTVGFCDNKKDAELILKACNSHYELLEALKEAIKYLPAFRTVDGNPVDHVEASNAYSKAKEAIKKAEL